MYSSEGEMGEGGLRGGRAQHLRGASGVQSPTLCPDRCPAPQAEGHDQGCGTQRRHVGQLYTQGMLDHF